MELVELLELSCTLRIGRPTAAGLQKIQIATVRLEKFVRKVLQALETFFLQKECCQKKSRKQGNIQPMGLICSFVSLRIYFC